MIPSIHKHITSLQNPTVKLAILLKHKARERKARSLFIAEGLRELSLALKNGYNAQTLLYHPDTTSPEEVNALLQDAVVTPGEIISVNKNIIEKVAYRSGVPNVVGIFSQKSTQDTSAVTLSKSGHPLILILEGIEKPGNLGAILRTADAAGVNAVWVCEPKFDLFNPNAIRASLGAIFTLNIEEVASTQAVQRLQQHHIPIYATWLEAARPLYDCDLTTSAALVLGAEATGITPFWVSHADHCVIIPMNGQVDSLNVASSAAIVLFEAVRQRLQQ